MTLLLLLSEVIVPLFGLDLRSIGADLRLGRSLDLKLRINIKYFGLDLSLLSLYSV